MRKFITKNATRCPPKRIHRTKITGESFAERHGTRVRRPTEDHLGLAVGPWPQNSTLLRQPHEGWVPRTRTPHCLSTLSIRVKKTLSIFSIKINCNIFYYLQTFKQITNIVFIQKRLINGLNINWRGFLSLKPVKMTECVDENSIFLKSYRFGTQFWATKEI